MWAAHEPASGRLHPNLDRSCVAHGYRAIRITDTRGLVARWPPTLTRTKEEPTPRSGPSWWGRCNNEPLCDR